MPNHNVHKLFGFLVWLLFVGLSFIFIDPFDVDMGLLFATGFVVCLVGSVLPDIDQKNSRVFRKLRIIVFVMVFVGSLVGGLYFSSLSILEVVGVSFAISIFVYVLLHLFMPRHRGVIHTSKVGLVYAGVVFLLAMLLFNSISVAVILFLAGEMSYVSHLLLDKI